MATADDEVSIGSVISLKSVAESDVDVLSTRKGKRPTSGTKKNKKLASPYGTPAKKKTQKKVGRELWLNSIQGGGGLSTENTAYDTWKNGRPKNTKQTTATEYLLEQFGVNTGKIRPTSASNPVRVGGKGPVYKDPESYYDEILALKRTLKQTRTEYDLLKAKNGRLQDENVSKSRTIEELLNPDSQSNDLRRTLTSKNPSGSEVVMSLRRRIYKLEENLRSKENELKKLSAEMKLTDIQELKIENQTYMLEIQRLHNVVQELKGKRHDFISDEVLHDALKDNKNNKVQVLLKRLTDDNRNLVLENKSLRNDKLKLTQSMGTSNANLNRDYEDMNRTELLQKITVLEQQLKEEEKSGGEKKENQKIKDASDGKSDDDVNVEGCIELKGSLSQQVKQLRARERELLSDVENLEATITKLKDERTHYRKMTDDYRKQFEDAKKELTAQETDRNAPNNSLNRKRSSSSVRKASVRSNEENLDTTKEKKPQTPERAEKVQNTKERRSSQKSIEDADRSKFNDKKMEEEDEYEEAVISIQSAWRAHHTRKNYVDSARQKEFSRQNDASNHQEVEEKEEDFDEDVLLIQSALRGHSARKQLLKKNQNKNISKSKEESAKVKEKFQENTIEKEKNSYSGNNAIRDSDESDDDDDVVIGSSASLTQFRNDRNRQRNPTIYRDPDSNLQNEDRHRHEKTSNQNANNLNLSRRSRGNLSSFFKEPGEEEEKEDVQKEKSSKKKSEGMTVNRLKSASKPWTNSRKETEESDEGTSPPSMKQRKSVLPQNKQSMKDSDRQSMTNKWANSGSKGQSKINEQNFRKKLSMRKTQQLLSDFTLDEKASDDDEDELIIAPSFQKRLSAAQKKGSTLEKTGLF